MRLILLGATVALCLVGNLYPVAFALPQPVPEWVYSNILDLAQAGVITLPPGITQANIHNLSRAELSKLTAEAMQKYRGNVQTSLPQQPAADTVHGAGRSAASNGELIKQYMVMNDELTQTENKLVQLNQQMRYLTLQLLANQVGVAIPAQSVKLGNGAKNTASRSTYPATAVSASTASSSKPSQLNPEQQSLYNKAANLQSTFRKELQNLGMDVTGVAADTKMSAHADEDKRAEEQDWKFNGEIRYSYRRNTGSDRFKYNDSYLRSRLFVRKRINDDWAAYGMLESRKYFLNQNPHSSEDDDWASATRLYVQGNTGITNITAGKFGYMMADGNIYDSDFKGVRFAVDEKPWTYTMAAGRTNANANTILGTATYRADNYDLGIGLYRFGDDDWGREKNSILVLRGDYYWDNFKFGLMYLGSDYNNDVTSKNGFVAGVQYKEMKSWRPGTYELYAKYYDQPYYTYRQHTMNGLADSMHGFKGFLVGFNIAFAPEWVFTSEYYRLKDKYVGDYGNTWWNAVSYNF